MNFILTVDTEADNQWQFGADVTLENIKFIPRFQLLCDKHLIRPTYLVTSEVCEDRFSKEFFIELLKNDKAEVGAHLHIWTTPPFLDIEGFKYNDLYHGYAYELPESILGEKIRTLTQQIEASFGKSPVSFRSGRYGLNDSVARILVENKYVVDSSVTPYLNWASQQGIPEGKGGPDFHGETPFPFHYSFPNGSLLEIPITILPTKFPLNRKYRVVDFYFKNVNKGILLKILRRLTFMHQPLWLRPFGWMNLGMIEELLNEAIRIKLPYIVMIIHSSEFMPGGSEYRANKESVESLFSLFESFFVILQKRNIKSLTLTEAAQDFMKGVL